MSSSGKQLFEFYNSPSGYSFRQGTLREILWQHFKTFFCIFLVLFVLFAALAIRALLETAMERLYTYHQAYLYEMGKLPRNFLDDWQQIFSLLSSIELPVFAELGLRIGLGVGLAIGTGVGTYFITILLLSRKSSNYAVWVVEHKQQIVGWASLLMQTNYTVLSTIYIDPKHRLQGVGSHLLWRCLKNVRKPVYLICYPHLQGFYARIGFVSLPNRICLKNCSSPNYLG